MTKDSRIVQQFEEFLAVRRSQGIESQITEVAGIVHTIEKVDSEMAFGKVQKRIKKRRDIDKQL